MKNKIRNIMRNKRQQLPLYVQQQTAAEIRDLVISTPVFQNSKKIAVYIAVKNELNPSFILSSILQQNKICYLPRTEIEKDLLTFVQYSDGDTLARSNYGIPEPVKDDGLIAPQLLDLVILPLVAFDKNNYRIGNGGGYYDKTFAFKLRQSSVAPTLMGIAYSFQQVLAFEPNPWDVQLDEIVTVNVNT